MLVDVEVEVDVDVVVVVVVDVEVAVVVDVDVLVFVGVPVQMPPVLAVVHLSGSWQPSTMLLLLVQQGCPYPPHAVQV